MVEDNLSKETAGKQSSSGHTSMRRPGKPVLQRGSPGQPPGMNEAPARAEFKKTIADKGVHDPSIRVKPKRAVKGSYASRRG